VARLLLLGGASGPFEKELANRLLGLVVFSVVVVVLVVLGRCSALTSSRRGSSAAGEGAGQRAVRVSSSIRVIIGVSRV